MTVINPNSVAGINSITVQSGNSLAVHKANGDLIRTITEQSGISTFSSISVGTATTDNSAGKSINIGLGASISQHTDNTLTFGTAGDPVAKFDASGQLLLGTGTARQKLHINASDSGAANIVFTNTTTGTSASDGFIVGISGAEDAQINMQESANLKFSTADTERLRITSSGRVNAVGIVSATGGLQVGAAATIKSNGNATFSGIVTATSFVGDGSGLSNITSTTINSNADNRVITGSDTANTLNGESNVVIDSNGNMGIGVASHDPLTALHVQGSNNAALKDVLTITNQNGSSGTEVGMVFECGADEVARISAKNEGSDIGPLIFSTASSQTADPSEKMRLLPNGALLINSTSQGDDELFKIFTDSSTPEMIQLRNNSAGSKDMITMMNVNNSGVVMIRFKQTGGLTNVGSITTSSSATAYNTSSDYRLKENEVLISDGITRLKTLKPYRFNFKTDPTKTVDGFFAHEVTAVPEAVHGEKDAVETTYYAEGDTIPEGKAIGDIKEENVVLPQSLDYAKITPLLTAALQEAITKIETLETKVAALEGG